jgi:hypothetical protein
VAVLPDLFAAFNDDVAKRVCGKCGHQNEPFPVAAWGWDKYATQSNTAITGREALRQAMRPASK